MKHNNKVNTDDALRNFIGDAIFGSSHDTDNSNAMFETKSNKKNKKKAEKIIKISEAKKKAKKVRKAEKKAERLGEKIRIKKAVLIHARYNIRKVHEGDCKLKLNKAYDKIRAYMYTYTTMSMTTNYSKLSKKAKVKLCRHDKNKDRGYKFVSALMENYTNSIRVKRTDDDVDCLYHIYYTYNYFMKKRKQKDIARFSVKIEKDMMKFRDKCSYLMSKGDAPDYSLPENIAKRRSKLMKLAYRLVTASYSTKYLDMRLLDDSYLEECDSSDMVVLYTILGKGILKYMDKKNDVAPLFKVFLTMMEDTGLASSLSYNNTNDENAMMGLYAILFTDLLLNTPWTESIINKTIIAKSKSEIAISLLFTLGKIILTNTETYKKLIA